MSVGNYVSAAISAVPIFGPIVAAHNVSAVESELENLQTKTGSVADSFRQSLDADIGKAVDRMNEKRVIEAYEKGRIYAAGGVLGSLGTLILRIYLYSLGAGVGLAPIWAGLTVWYGYKLHQYHTAMKASQEQQKALLA